MQNNHQIIQEKKDTRRIKRIIITFAQEAKSKWDRIVEHIEEMINDTKNIGTKLGLHDSCPRFGVEQDIVNQLKPENLEKQTVDTVIPKYPKSNQERRNNNRGLKSNDSHPRFEVEQKIYHKLKPRNLEKHTVDTVNSNHPKPREDKYNKILRLNIIHTNQQIMNKKYRKLKEEIQILTQEKENINPEEKNPTTNSDGKCGNLKKQESM